MKFEITAVTDKGEVKPVNQDGYCAKIMEIDGTQYAAAVICDGVGGLSRGEDASATVVRDFSLWCERMLPTIVRENIDEETVFSSWSKLMDNCNSRLYQYACNNGIKMGTTATAILLTDTKYFIAHIGDTRVYEIGNLKVKQLTTDQTVAMQECLRGNLSSAQAEVDKRNSILLQCVGGSSSLSPELCSGELQPQAIYLLCTDGFRHKISQTEIFSGLLPRKMVSVEILQTALKELVAVNKQRHEKDNITAVALRAISEKQRN